MPREKSNEKEKTGKGTAILICSLIVITWLSVMALLIKCDVGGFGSEVLRPVFKDVPVIKYILPPPSDEEVAIESDYPYDTLEEALAQIAIMDKSIGSKDAEIAALNDRVTELQAEVARLTVYEEEKMEFDDEKNKFYEEIVYGDSAPDTDIYIEWYDSIDAEHAEKIYREIIESNLADEEILELAAAYESMEPAAAAKILQNMSNDMDTVALIMNNMSSKAQGDVLAAMDSDFAAAVTKKLLP